MTLLTVRSAAERLGVAYSTLKRWVHTGHVRTTRTEGGHHRISEAEIRTAPGPQSAAAETQTQGRRRRRDRWIERAEPSPRVRGRIRVDGLLAQVRLRVGDQSLTAVITADAVGALKLQRGDDAIAIIKSTGR